MLRRDFTRAALFALALAAGCASEKDSSNRDLHGPSDVERYIERLASDARIADLEPDKVIAKLAPAQDAVIADLGCGPGVFAVRFARAVPRGMVYAIDVEPQQLDELRRRLIENELENVVPVLASYSTPHLPPASCDLVFIADTYHHLDDRVAYMSRLARALKSGGRLAILEYKPGPLPVGPKPDHKLPAGVMERELTEAGWKRAESFDTHPNHTFEVWTR